MLGGRNKATEDDRVRTGRNEGLEFLNRRIELRISCSDEVFGALYQAGKRPRVIEAGGWFNINRICFVSIVVEYLLFQAVGLGGEPVAERASCGGR
jgi:hypothetical protein